MPLPKTELFSILLKAHHRIGELQPKHSVESVITDRSGICWMQKQKQETASFSIPLFTHSYNLRIPVRLAAASTVNRKKRLPPHSSHSIRCQRATSRRLTSFHIWERRTKHCARQPAGLCGSIRNGVVSWLSILRSN